MATASSAYISASTNRFSHAADISSSSLVAYGSSQLVALWDVTDLHDPGVKETLPGHEGDVTCVSFARDDLLVTADNKGQVRCWRKFGLQWKSTAVLQGHEKAITSLCVLDQILVTGSSDSLVKVWSITFGIETDQVAEVQVLSLHGKYSLALALVTLPGSTATMLAIAGTDHKVHIWTRSEETFIRSVVLPGHEDWVRSLAFRAPEAVHDPLVLASGSQDGTIRLWSIEIMSRDKPKEFSLGNTNTEQLNDELLDAFEASLGDLADGEEGGRQISLKRHVLTVKTDQGSQQFSITFDALLIGHEAGITSLSWRPTTSNPQADQRPTLLSTSTDSSVILWSPSNVITSSQDGSTSIWINRQRFGDIGGQRLGGFIGGLWSKKGTEAMAWGWSGGWRRWRCDDEKMPGSEGIDNWSEIGAVGGHSGPIKDLDWSPKGEYLISVGLDQTTRMHGAIQTADANGALTYVWHELSRPQVHGYDIVGVRFLDALKFVSIADEKVARVFEAPRVFVDLAKGLGVLDSTISSEERPLGASVPPLGLSNKAVREVLPTGPNPDTPIRRPFEGELASTTLWPEVEKVFGHGYELISLAVSNDKRMIATGCRASSADHAVIRVYEADTWQLYGLPLEGHALTVTRISFSPDNRFILTVSRDRSWRLFEKKEGGFIPTASDKSHTRIIWDCAWSNEGDIFATASRDKTVKIWEANSAASQRAALTTIKVKEAATSLAFCPANTINRRMLAVGLETGEVLVYSSVSSLPSKWDLDLTIDSRTAHVNQIHRMAWRPLDDRETQIRQLATCSEDGTLKILIVHTG